MVVAKKAEGLVGHNRYVPEQWSIGLLGGFSLRSPLGQPVEVTSKKARALIALLALNRGTALPRRDLAVKLWPDKAGEQRLQNLRKAVQSVVSSTAAAPLLGSDHEACWLIPGVWTCEALDILEGRSEPTGVPFLPEMDVPALDEWRLEFELKIDRQDGEAEAANAAVLLQWVRERNPAQVIDFLWSIQQLVPMLPVQALVNSLDRALRDNPDHPCSLWASVQLATAQMWAGQTRTGLATVRTIFSTHDPNRDTVTWVETAFTAAMNLIFLGRFERAVGFICGAIHTLREEGLVDCIDRLEHAKGHAKGYGGKPAAAAKVLVGLCAKAEAPAVMGFRRAHAAMYMTLAGQLDEAWEYLATAKLSSEEVRDARLETQVAVAASYWHLYRGQPDEACSHLTHALGLGERLGIPLVTIHALEGFALLASQEGERRERLSAARRLRELHRLPLLPLDRIRLRSVLE